MRRLFGWAAVLAVAPLILVEPTRAPAAESKAAQYGYGPAYDAIGKLPIMHSGRVKPLDTVAREEIKVIYSRETIKFRDEKGDVVSTWSPVGAFLDWAARPEFWDDQKFILVEYLPLKQVILAENVKVELKAIADKATTSAADRKALLDLADKPQISHTDLKSLLAGSKLADADGKALFRLATQLGEETKWLSPNDLEKAVVTVDGHRHSFNEWISELSEKGGEAGAMSGGKPKLSELERKAFDVGTNYFRYRVHRDGQVLSQLQILGMPRPFLQDSDAYLKFYANAVTKFQEQGRMALSPVEMDALATVSKFLENLPVKDHDEIGGKNAEFNNKFKLWLRDKAAWVPLPVVLKEKVETLQAAGYPTDRVESLRKAYDAWQADEQKNPGQVSLASSDAVIQAAHALGTAVNSVNYPSDAKMAQEAHFNSFAPFYLCQYAFGLGAVVLLTSLLISAVGAAVGRESSFAYLAKAAYFVGLAGFVGGIGLEIYGFYLRVAISGWAPVTNMYETVIWVALVGAFLGLILEGIYPKTYIAMAATTLGFLTTLIAYNSSSILDPNIKALQPVLRSNLWLTIHVLTIVSSYAAFALALVLGLIASVFYLTATYRRAPSLPKLVSPIFWGAPLAAVGVAGIYGSFGDLDLGQAVKDYGFYPFAGCFAVGLVAASTGAFALVGEILSWAFFHESDSERLAASSQLSEHAELAASAEAGWEAGSYKSEAAVATAAAGGAVATAPPPAKSSVLAAVRSRQAEGPRLTAREAAMQNTANLIKPLSSYTYRAMQVGVLLVAAGTILGGVWADYSWGRFWGWDPKEVWALITLLVYLIPLHGRFAGWINTSTLILSSVVCFMSVLMAWYGVNFVLGVGLHSYGFAEGGSQGLVASVALVTMGFGAAATWRRYLGMQSPVAA